MSFNYRDSVPPSKDRGVIDKNKDKKFANNIFKSKYNKNIQTYTENIPNGNI